MANVPISAFTVPANTVGIGATGYSLTGSASASFMDLAGTWNTTGTPTLIKANVTDTASNAASLLMDLQVGGTSRFNVSKAGTASASTGFYATNTIDVNIGVRLYGINGGTISLGGVGGGIYFTSTNNFGSTADTILTRRAAANLRFGAADAAAPVAQTLSVQSVVAGTTNTAGANLTITGSQGTGSGAAGTIAFQTASAGASGTSQNALATVATIGPSTLSGSQAISLLDLSQTWNTSGTPTGLKFNVTDTASPSASLMMDLQVGGVSRLYVRKDGQVITLGGFGGQGPITTSSYIQADSSTGIWLRNAGGTVSFGNPADVNITRDASNTLAQRNANNGQIFRLYGRFTDITNDFERFFINAPTTSGDAVQLGTQKGATAGTARALELQTDGTTRLTIAATSGNVTTTGSVTTEAPTGGTAAAWRLGTVATVTPTLQNRTIEVDIGGTIYYISAKTTND